MNITRKINVQIKTIQFLIPSNYKNEEKTIKKRHKNGIFKKIIIFFNIFQLYN